MGSPTPTPRARSKAKNMVYRPQLNAALDITQPLPVPSASGSRKSILLPSNHSTGRCRPAGEARGSWQEPSNYHYLRSKRFEETSKFIKTEPLSPNPVKVPPTSRTKASSIKTEPLSPGPVQVPSISKPSLTSMKGLLLTPATRAEASSQAVHQDAKLGSIPAAPDSPTLAERVAAERASQFVGDAVVRGKRRASVEM